MAGKRRYGAEFKAKVTLEALTGELRNSRVRSEATYALLRAQSGILGASKAATCRTRPSASTGFW